MSGSSSGFPAFTAAGRGRDPSSSCSLQLFAEAGLGTEEEPAGHSVRGDQVSGALWQETAQQAAAVQTGTQPKSQQPDTCTAEGITGKRAAGLNRKQMGGGVSSVWLAMSQPLNMKSQVGQEVEQRTDGETLCFLDTVQLTAQILKVQGRGGDQRQESPAIHWLGPLPVKKLLTSGKEGMELSRGASSPGKPLKGRLKGGHEERARLHPRIVWESPEESR